MGTWEQQLLFWLCIGLSALFLWVAAALLRGSLVAPYGRYSSAEETCKQCLLVRIFARCPVNARAAWVLQECPNLLAAAACWHYGDPACKSSAGNLAVLLCFVLHYVNRALVYPFRMSMSKPVPLPVMLSAMCFCALNGYLQSRTLTRFCLLRAADFTTPLGVAIWVTGVYINADADHILRTLRKPGETGYKIPHGGMFKYVSGANFFGESLEWAGYAVAMGGALPGLTFALCTVANIGPRALEHHRWYLQKFRDEYPRERRAFIPRLL